MAVLTAPLPECTNPWHDRHWDDTYTVTAKITDGPDGAPTGELVTATTGCRDCAIDYTDGLPVGLVHSYDIPGY